MRRLRGFGLAIALLVAVACSGGSPSATPSASPSPAGGSPSGEAPSPTPSASESPGPPRLASVHVRLKQVASVDGALAMAVRSGDPALYIASQGGHVVRLLNGRVATVLDLSGRIASGGEQGLLGLAFAPDGRFMYVNYTDRNGDTN